MKEQDIIKQVETSNDLDYLRELDRYVDMDIASVGNESDVIKQMKAKMFNMTVEERERKMLEFFQLLKNKIAERISILSKKNDTNNQI